MWICRDWAGSHIFLDKPARTNNGYKEDEWYSYLSSLDDVLPVRDMVNEFTKPTGRCTPPTPTSPSTRAATRKATTSCARSASSA